MTGDALKKNPICASSPRSEVSEESLRKGQVGRSSGGGVSEGGMKPAGRLVEDTRRGSLTRRELQGGASLARQGGGGAQGGGAQGLLRHAATPDVPNHTFETRIETLLRNGAIDQRQSDALSTLRRTLTPRHWQTELNKFGSVIPGRGKGSHAIYRIRNRRFVTALGHADELKVGTRNAMVEQLLSILEEDGLELLI